MVCFLYSLLPNFSTSLTHRRHFLRVFSSVVAIRVECEIFIAYPRYYVEIIFRLPSCTYIERVHLDEINTAINYHRFAKRFSVFELLLTPDTACVPFTRLFTPHYCGRMGTRRLPIKVTTRRITTRTCKIKWIRLIRVNKTEKVMPFASYLPRTFLSADFTLKFRFNIRTRASQKTRLFRYN